MYFYVEPKTDGCKYVHKFGYEKTADFWWYESACFKVDGNPVLDGYEHLRSGQVDFQAFLNRGLASWPLKCEKDETTLRIATEDIHNP